MNFNKHSEIRENEHAFLSPSKWHWLNYSPDKLIEVYQNFLAAQNGTRLHAWAAETIDLGRKQPRSKQTLNMYINDAIGYRMTPEQKLVYSYNCFGKADAIAFKDNMLRIHDLKTGAIPGHMEQLLVYAALFCLEYGIDPEKICTELRIYQDNDIQYMEPTDAELGPIMDKIKSSDKIVEELKRREG